MQSLSFFGSNKTLLIYSLTSCQCYFTQFTNDPTLIVSFLLQHSSIHPFNIIFDKLLITINVQISHISERIYGINEHFDYYNLAPIIHQISYSIKQQKKSSSTVLYICEIPLYTIMTGFLTSTYAQHQNCNNKIDIKTQTCQNGKYTVKQPMGAQ